MVYQFDLENYPRGITLFKTGDEVKKCYFIKEGKVQIQTKVNDKCKNIIEPNFDGLDDVRKYLQKKKNVPFKVTNLSRGSIFGEEEITNGIKYRCYTAKVASERL